MNGVFRFPPLTPFVKKLLIGLLGFFVAELILQNWAGLQVFQELALYPADPGLSTAWQLFTYALVWPPEPGSVVGVLIGLVFMWWIMAPFEARFGSKRTMQLTGVTLLAASVPALLGGLVFSQGARVAGFGPILIGTIAAFAWSIRGQGQLSLFGVVPMKPVHLIYLLIGVSVLFFLASRNVPELLANLGAIGGGIGFIRWLSRPPGRHNKPKSPKSKRSQAPFTVIEGGGEGRGESPSRWLN